MLIIIALSLFLPSCIVFELAGWNKGKTNFIDEDGRLGAFTPKPLLMGELPQGDDDYSQGFRDGCNTAISILGTGFQSTMFEDIYYDFDKILESSDYFKGKTIGFDYCTYFIDVDPL